MITVYPLTWNIHQISNRQQLKPFSYGLIALHCIFLASVLSWHGLDIAGWSIISWSVLLTLEVGDIWNPQWRKVKCDHFQKMQQYFWQKIQLYFWHVFCQGKKALFKQIFPSGDCCHLMWALSRTVHFGHDLCPSDTLGTLSKTF